MRIIRKCRLLITIVLLIFLNSSCSKKEVRIKIIQTSDVHGAIFPYDIVTGEDRSGSLSQVYNYVEGERSIPGQSVILVDNGDILQGDPAIYYSNYLKPEKEHILSRVMNYMKYDLGTVGNHDIEPGHDVYDKFNSELNFPWLAANAIDIESRNPYFKPYVIIEKEGVKIAFLGLITPAIPQWLSSTLYKGIEFNDMIESAGYWIDIIQKEEPDLVVGLFHSGVEYTYNNQTESTYKNENASRLIAEKVPGFDVIMVGHDHHGWNEYVKNIEGDSVLLAGPTSKASNVVSIDISFVGSEAEFVVNNMECNIVEMNDFNPDEDFIATFSKDFDEVSEYFSQPLANFTDDMPATDAIFGSSAFVDFVHNIQLASSDASISFSSSMSFSDTISEGEFKLSDLFKMYKYDNLLYEIELTAKEIDGYLEYSYGNWFSIMNSVDDHLIKFKLDEEGKPMISESNGKPILDGRFYNFDSAVGIDYTVDISEEPGNRISIIWNDKEHSDPDYKYRVALNSYRANGGGGHLTFGAGIPFDSLSSRVVSISNHDMRWIIMNWIKYNTEITPKAYNNWKVIPDNLYEAGRERDFELIYGE